MAAEYKGRSKDRDATRPDGYSKSRKPSKGRPKRRQKPATGGSKDIGRPVRPPIPLPGASSGPGMAGFGGGPAVPIFPGMA